MTYSNDDGGVEGWFAMGFAVRGFGGGRPPWWARVVWSLALAVPVYVLFTQSWAASGAAGEFASQEQQGIEYLAELSKVTTAVTDAQSAAVRREPVARESVIRAVDAMTTVDNRYGEALRSRERWSGLRVKIEALLDRDLPDADTALVAYSEVTDLVLALYGQVRDQSKLIRDPEADAYYLEDGGTEELPESVVMAGRFADLATLALSRPVAERARFGADLAAGRAAAIDPAADLADDLQAAVDSTRSRTLSSNLLSRLDRYQQAVEALPQAATITAAGGALEAAALSAARIEVQTAASELASTILSELKVLVGDRADRLAVQRQLTAAMLVFAILLVVAPFGLGLLRAGRTRPAGPTGPATGPGRPGERPEPPPGDRREPAMAGSGRGSPGGDDLRAWWERSGAAR